MRLGAELQTKLYITQEEKDALDTIIKFLEQLENEMNKIQNLNFEDIDDITGIVWDVDIYELQEDLFSIRKYAMESLK